jgi:IS30 family transposase
MPGKRLTYDERRTIERCYAMGLSQDEIALVIGRSQPTVSRELARNGGRGSSFHDPGSRSPRRGRGRAAGQGYRRLYCASAAHRSASRRGRRPKKRRMLHHQPLRFEVHRLLRADWSPQQIAQMLPELFPDDPRMRVSHETIYESLFVQTKGELKRELTAHLRTRRQRRQPQGSGVKRVHLGITEDIRISARPAEAEDRAVPGHWEGDLLMGGQGQGAVITLVERATRFVLLAPLPDRHTADLCRAELARLMGRLPVELRKSLTWDQGSEMAQHAQFRIETGIPVYFCDPHSPWQRGTNENTNGLLRQYWPKGADLRGLTRTECDNVALRLNTRPRMTLEWKTPGQALNRLLDATTD